MAQTEKGIIYPYDYNEVADVPSDFKALAESIDRILSDYSLNTESGNKIVLEINNTTYKIKAILKDKDNNVINTSNEIDLPLENMVTNVAYNNQKLILTHQDGHTTEISIADLISDLASKEEVEELQSQVDDLTTLVETELDTNEVEGTEIDVSDSAEYPGKIIPGANLEQAQLSGKNRFALQNINQTLNGITLKYDAEKQEFLANGTCTSDNTVFNLFFWTKQFIGALTTVSAHYLEGSVDNYAVLRNYDTNFEGNTPLYLTDLNSLRPVVSKTSESTYQPEKFSIRFNNGSVANNFRFKVMVADSIDTTYEPYCGGASPNPDYPQDIKVVTGDNVIKHVGKNLLDMSNTTTSQGVTSTQNNDGSINLIGTLTNTWFNITNSVNLTKIKLTAGTYIFSFDKAFDFKIRIRFYEKNSSTEYVNYTVEAGQTTIPITLTKEYDKFFVYAFNAQQGTVLNKTIKFQLEEGSTATPYEPYKEENFNLNLGNIELCKIGDYEDIPFKNVVGDENYNSSLTEWAWYKKEIINKRTLNSSEIAIANNDSYNNITYASFGKDSNDYVYNTFSNKKAFSNVMIYDNSSFSPGWDNSEKIGFLFSNATSKYYWYGVEKGTSLEQIQSKLNGALLYTVRATAKYTQITNPTLISQLEALRKAKWFKGVNHFWTETENLEPNLKGTYKQSNNLRLQALEQAVVALGGV